MASPTYNDYEAWFSIARSSYLEPARETAVRLLQELLDIKIDPVDRGRFRISNSRVKSLQRSFTKLNGEKYRAHFESYESVPELLDDLVGIRLVCNNLSDIVRFQEVIGELPVDDGTQAIMTVERGSHRDYFSEPKASGYRAYHVNLVLPISRAQGVRRVRVEVQVRTLLQDGWGELTHEDTYKPGSRVPEWIVRMSLRMADLLAAIDDIAQDLRADLDRETRNSSADLASSPAHLEPLPAIYPAIVIDPPVQTSENSPPGQVDAETEVKAAVFDDVRRLIEGLDKPVSLAMVSQHLVTTFGTDIAELWSSASLKDFLEENVDDIAITGPMPGYVHPKGSDVSPWPRIHQEVAGLPAILPKLRHFEKTVPLIDASRMRELINAVCAVLRHDKFLTKEPQRISAAELARLARLCRTYGETNGVLVVRPHAQYVLQALNRASLISTEITVARVRSTIITSLLTSARRHEVDFDTAETKSALMHWLRGE